MLFPDLPPCSAVLRSLRSVVTPAVWRDWCQAVAEEARYACTSCSVVSPKTRGHTLHEVWDFDVQTQVQSLRHADYLCDSCHRLRHPALLLEHGHGTWLFEQLQAQHGGTVPELTAAAAAAFLHASRRMAKPWRLDVRSLASNAVTPYDDLGWCAEQRLIKRWAHVLATPLQAHAALRTPPTTSFHLTSYH